MRPSTVARLAVGTACLVGPGPVLRAVRAPDHADPRVRAVARVLGARLLAQAGLDLARPGRSHRLDVGVEVTHAASMLPVALRSRTHRRAASASAAVATGLASCDILERSA
jgi:hypothetical protein